LTFIPSVIIFVVGVISGFVLKFYILKKLKAHAEKTKTELDDIIIKSLNKNIFQIILFLTFYLTIKYLPLTLSSLTVILKILLSLIILFSFLLLSNFIVLYLNSHKEKFNIYAQGMSIIKNLTQLVVLIIAGLIILQQLGISITPILTAFGIGGLAVALALQDTLGNLFSGLHILATRKIRPGDYIKLDSGEEGYVVDITWRNTVIRQLPNNLVIIPNTKLSSAIVVNYNMPEEELAVLIQVGVSYDSDLEKVEKITIEVGKEVMKEVNGGIPSFEPFIRYHTFDDFSINFTVILRAKEFVDQYLIKHEFIKRLKKRYDKEGIEIPFPIRTIYMKNARNN